MSLKQLGNEQIPAIFLFSTNEITSKLNITKHESLMNFYLQAL